MNILLLKYRNIFIFFLIGLVMAVLYFASVKEQESINNAAGKLIFSPEQSEWIKKNPIITVGVDLDFAPIEYLDENNTYIGVTADFLSLMEKKTGLVFKIDQKHT